MGAKKKDKQINTLISELKPLIQDIGDAPESRSVPYSGC